MSNIEALEKKIADLREERKQLEVLYGQMTHTPERAETYSKVKLVNWGKDIDRLREKEDELQAEIDRIKGDPKHQAEQQALIYRLAAARNELNDQLTAAKRKFDDLRYANSDHLAKHPDSKTALERAIELHELHETIDRLTEAAAICNGAIVAVEKKLS